MQQYKCEVVNVGSASRGICYKLGAHQWEMAEVEA